jgi:hypothetical protein
MSSFKKVDLSRDFCVRGVYLSEAQNPIPPLLTVYMKNSILIHIWRGGGESLTREKGRGANVLKAVSKIQHE